jgi:hypothetical protein
VGPSVVEISDGRTDWETMTVKWGTLTERDSEYGKSKELIEAYSNPNKF